MHPSRYSIKEVIGKGSYGVVCSAIDNFTGEKVAIKKINNVFEHVSDSTRILREIKLLRLLKHPGASASMAAQRGGGGAGCVCSCSYCTRLVLPSAVEPASAAPACLLPARVW
jgi:serine/threonine protein kinase